MQLTGRRGRYGAGLALLLVVAAGCGSAGTEDLGNAPTLIASAEASTAIPPGSHFDASIFRTEQGASYQTGWFLSSAESDAQCKWYGYWLTAFAANDSTAMNAATAAFKVMETWPLFSQTDPGTRQFYESLTQKAQLGDPSAMQQFVSVNCKGLTP
jgi:hypothetical protein